MGYFAPLLAVISFTLTLIAFISSWGQTRVADFVVGEICMVTAVAYCFRLNTNVPFTRFVCGNNEFIIGDRVSYGTSIMIWITVATINFFLLGWNH